jgi:hypothetical protein
MYSSQCVAEYCVLGVHVQWVFIGEGVPSVLLGMCLPWLLPDGPHASDGSVTRWLAPHEVQLLQADVSSCNGSVADVAHVDQTAVFGFTS